MPTIETIEADLAVIGAGVVGCAIAYEMASRGLSVIVLEKDEREGTGISSRNSGVIHAGIYYTPGSLKADLCIEGQRLLYDWCTRFKVSFAKTGKLVVATDASEDEDLDWLWENARASGAPALERLTSFQLNEFSCLKVHAAIYSPMTGIVDPAMLTRSFRMRAEEAGTDFVFNTEVDRIEADANTFLLHSTRGKLRVGKVINSAGLYADTLSQGHPVYPWRGDYFSLRRKIPIPHLVYPVKKRAAPGLGVHLTIEMDGRQRLGPDVKFARSKEDFAAPEDLLLLQEQFYESASRYLPELQLSDLVYDTCGIRPKLRAPSGNVELDFRILEEPKGFWHLLGIESPGLTASLAIAKKLSKAF